MKKAILLAALVAAVVCGPAAGASAQGVPGGAADEQYCTPAEAQYGACDEDVTIIVRPPGAPSGGAGAEEIIPGPDVVSGGAVPAVTSASPGPSSVTTAAAGGQVGGATAGTAPGVARSEAGTVSVLPDTGGITPPVPALAGLLTFLIGAALLLSWRSRI